MVYVALIIGFILLVKGADYFVDGASAIAKRLKVPSLIIGLTIVAFGTSAPEAAVSITSAIQGQNEIAIGNVVGSNIFNILVVVGIAAMIYPLKVEKTIITKELPMTLLASSVLIILTADPFFQGVQGYQGYQLTRGDGIILLTFFGIFMYTLIGTALKARKEDIHETVEDREAIMSLKRSIVVTSGGLLAVIVGGKLVVDYASIIAAQWGMSESLIGLTIVAIGTSLPELVTSILAAKKGESDIALGNVVGSNIFNIFFILGTASVIAPLQMAGTGLIDMGVMVATAFIVFIMTLMRDRIGKGKGIILVSMYLGYMAWLII